MNDQWLQEALANVDGLVAIATTHSRLSSSVRPGFERARAGLEAHLRTALAAPQPAAESVAEVYDTFGNSRGPGRCTAHVWLKRGWFPPRGTQLYASSPSPRLPVRLSEAQIETVLGEAYRDAVLRKILNGGMAGRAWDGVAARAIQSAVLAANGISGE